MRFLKQNVSLWFTPIIIFFTPFIELASNKYAFSFFKGEIFIALIILILMSFCFSLGFFIKKSKNKLVFKLYFLIPFSFILYQFSFRFFENIILSSFLFFIPYILITKVKINEKLFSFLSIIIISLNTLLLIVSTPLFQFDFDKNIPSLIDKTNITTIKEKPNIYHLLIDEVAFDDYLNYLKASNQLKIYNQFSFYSNMVANYSFTWASTLSVFAGKQIPNKTKMESFRDKTINGENFLTTLKENDYNIMSTDALHRFSDLNIELNSRGSIADYATVEFYKASKLLRYFAMYLYKYTPFFNSKYFISNIYPYDHIKDVLSFKKYLELEKDLPAIGRYSFLYLSTPHFPYVFNENCTIHPLALSTDYNPSLRCAHKLINLFLNKLKELKRFDNSIIIIHSDHGRHTLSFTTERIKLGEVNLHRPFFAMKLPKQKDFKLSSKSTQLLDLAPTLLSLIGIKPSNNFEGANFLDENFMGHNKRLFHYIYPFHNKNGYRFELDQDQNVISKKDYILYSKFKTRM